MIINKRKECQTCSIRSITILKNASPALLELFNVKKHCIFYSRGEQIIKEGTDIDGVYLISSGIVKIHKRGKSGRDFIMRFATTGAMLGAATDEREKHTFSATAIEDCNICFVEISDFLEALKKFPELKDEVIASFEKHLRQTELRALNIAHLSVKEKVAETLFSLAKLYNLEKRKGLLRVNVGRQEVADIIGSTKEQVSKFYGEFEKENIIEARGRYLKINDMQKLEEVFSN